HMGTSEDNKLAEQTDMFDVIVGGHSHTAYSEAKNINGTTIVQTGSDLDNLGHLELKIDKENKEIIDVDWSRKAVASMTEVDEEVQAMIDGYYDEMSEVLEEKIGYSEEGLSSYGKSARDVPLGNF